MLFLRLRHAIALLITASLTTGLAVLAGPAASAAAIPVSKGFFGVTDHQPSVAGAAGWPRAPIGSIRLWDTGVSWRELEVRPGVWDFRKLDKIVATSRAHGARPLLVLGQTPRFHATRPTWVGFYGAGAPTVPKLNAWKRYVAAVAQRYRGNVDYQVWNEPNVVGMWRGSPQQMATLTYLAKHVLDVWAPNARLVAPSFPVRLAAQRAWVARYYAARSAGRPTGSLVDVVSLNLYPAATGSPETSMALLRQSRAILARYHVRRPVWNTEINYGMTGDGSNARNISRRREAANVTRTYVLNAANRVGRVYWYSWDLHGLGNTEMTYGNNASLAPAGVAFNVTATWLTGGRLRSCTVSGNGTYTCTVGSSTGVRRIYWNPSRTASVTAVGSATQWQGMLGKTKTLRGNERLTVSYAPIMVRSSR
jgi:hypothetical protein